MFIAWQKVGNEKEFLYGGPSVKEILDKALSYQSNPNREGMVYVHDALKGQRRWSGYATVKAPAVEESKPIIKPKRKRSHSSV